MLIDSLVSFVPPDSPLSLVAGAGVSIPSTVIDLIGNGVGTAPPNIIGTASVFGTDLGIGELKAQIEVLVTTALATATGALLTTAFQLAADDPTTHLPVTWFTIIDQPNVSIANTALGKRVARFDYPPVIPETLRPRYARLLFSPGAGASFTAGAIVAPVTMQRDDWAEAQQPRNYAVKRPDGT